MAAVFPGAVPARRPTGAVHINMNSPFARHLRAWFPLNGLTSAVGPRRPVMANGWPSWEGTTRGRAFESVQGGGGTGPHVETAASQFTDLNGLGTFSLGVRIWARSAGTGNFGRIITMTDGADFALGMGGSSTSLYFQVNGTSDTAASSVELRAWQDIVAVYQSGVQKAIWVNGVKYPLTTRTGTLSVTSETLVIANRADAQRTFDGYITDVALWTCALSDSLARSWYDPATRWSLYWQPGRTVFFDMVAAGNLTPDTVPVSLLGQSPSLGFAIHMPDEL